MKNTLAAYSSAFFEELAKGHSELSEDQKKDFYEFKIHTRHFCETGRKEDAFTVYFCYAEIFAPLGKGYANTKHIVELLSDHEHHAGELLTKHRDHYSHSAYSPSALRSMRRTGPIGRLFNAFTVWEGKTTSPSCACGA